jgi:hypothetical protein
MQGRAPFAGAALVCGVSRPPHPLTCPSQALHPRRARQGPPGPGFRWRRSDGHNSGALARAPFDRGPRCGLRRRARSRPCPHWRISAAASGASRPRRSNRCSTPFRMACCTAAMPSWPSAVASRNLTPSAWTLNGTAVGAPRRSPTNTGTAASNTPSIMAQWKCRLALSAEPNRWPKVTAPTRASEGAPGLCALSRS